MTTRVTVAAEELGVTYRQLDTWLSNGLVPGIEGRDTGSGYQRELDAEQMAFLRVMVLLVGLGINPRRAAQLVVPMRRDMQVKFKEVTLSLNTNTKETE